MLAWRRRLSPPRMTMSDSVLAAIIAGTATLSASFLQLRTARLRDGPSRAPSPAQRRRSRLQLIVLLAIIGAAGASGFALSQWLDAGARAAQHVLESELQARVAEIGRTAGQLELTRGSQRLEIESGVLRRQGAEGSSVLAIVPPCRPAVIVTAAAGSPTAETATESAPAVRACTESEASTVTVCTTIPANAAVSEVLLFSRVEADVPWNASRFLPGQESGQARFADKYTESTPEAGVRQVCQGFAHWSVEHARTVRMIVRYSVPA
jgi:hypothetical protein